MISILLADEQVVVRRGLRSLLEERSDCRICAETSNGLEAVEFALRYKPEIAVLDINLPALGGIEVTRRIRKLAPATEVLIFTALQSEEIIRDAVVAGARGYVLKSESDDQIVKAIDTLAETPQLDQDPVLVRKQPGFYEHENQTLRTLLPVQKQFLLLGPENRRKIIAWLKLVAGNLDLKTG